jgi:hypothetical protein
MQAAVTTRISNLNLTLAPSIARPRPCSVHLHHCASRPQQQQLDRQQQLLSRWSRPLHLARAGKQSSCSGGVGLVGLVHGPYVLGSASYRRQHALL